MLQHWKQVDLKYLKIMLLSIIAVFSPVQGMLVTAAFLVVADFILGVIAAKKRGEKITSNKMSRTVGKIVLYELALALGYLAEHYLMNDFMPVTRLIGGVIGLSECTSILENLDTIFQVNIFEALIQKFSSKSDKNPPPSDPS